MEKLISLVSQNIFGQVLITDTDVDRIRQLFEAVNVSYTLFEVNLLNPQEEVYG